MSKIKLLALFGESSAGKDSIQHWLTHTFKNMHGITSYTTRPPRDYEVEGREYHFISDIKFKTLIESNKMLEYTKFNNWYYGTYINELDKNKLMLVFLIQKELKIFFLILILMFFLFGLKHLIKLVY